MVDFKATSIIRHLVYLQDFQTSVLEIYIGSFSEKQGWRSRQKGPKYCWTSMRPSTTSAAAPLTLSAHQHQAHHPVRGDWCPTGSKCGINYQLPSVGYCYSEHGGSLLQSTKHKTDHIRGGR